MTAFRRALAVVAGHLAFVVWLTWPLATTLATRVPHTRDIASTDLSYSAWVLAWEAHVLTTHPTALLDANVYHPAVRPLFYGPTYFAALPVFAPVWWATGNATLAINVVFLAALAGTAAALHWVVWRWTRSHAAGAVAGATFLLSRWTLDYFVPTVPPYGVLWYLPFVVAAVATPAASWRQARRLVPLVVLQSLTDLVFVGGAVFAPAAAIALARVVRPATRRVGLRLCGALALAVVCLVPLALGYVEVRLREPNLAHQSVWQTWRENVPLPFGVLDERVPLAVPHVTWAVVAAGALVLGWRRGPRAAPRAAWGHAALWLVLGTALALDRTSLPGVGAFRMGHFVLLDALGIGSLLRISTRFAVAALVGVALLAGLAVAECTRGRRAVAAGVAALVIGLMYAECRLGWLAARDGRTPLAASYPLEATPARSPVTDRLRALPDAVVLELPLFPRAVAGLPHARAMLRSTYHWRPLLNGYGSYYPSGFAERMETALRVPDDDAVAALVREAGLTHLLVTAATPFARTTWLNVLRRPDSPLRLEASDDVLLLLAIRPPAQSPGAGPTAPSGPTT